MKGYTSIEQSKKLLELGLDPESADMVYPAWTLSDTPTEDIVNIRRHDYENDNDVPCWSLAALLELMSEYTLESNELGMHKCACISHITNACNTPIDAAVEMVIWLLENGYIEKK